MRVYVYNGDESHWVAAVTEVDAVKCLIEEEMEETPDLSKLKLLTEAELDEATYTELDQHGKGTVIPLREALNEAIAEGLEPKLLASTIFYEAFDGETSEVSDAELD